MRRQFLPKKKASFLYIGFVFTVRSKNHALTEKTSDIRKMKKMPILFCLLGFLSVSVVAGQTTLNDKPNFVVIMTDDQGYQDLGCYGSLEIKTPRLDQMAKEGMKFTSFYAQTVCGPARAALMTGCYPMRVERAEGDKGEVPHPAMSLDEITVAELLKQLGYKTEPRLIVSGTEKPGLAPKRLKLHEAKNHLINSA